MKREAMTIRFDSQLLERLRNNAKLDGRSLNQEINEELWLIVKKREYYLKQKASHTYGKPSSNITYHNTKKGSKTLEEDKETLATEDETFDDIFADLE